ncbi:MAG: T9SS type A sorting domain-containing protein [Bacteroidales bacterium]|nr:T9SS type A sorting domain-containing protein [Bacteroidales bacterium]
MYDMNGRGDFQLFTTSTDLISIDISTSLPGVYEVEILDKGKVEVRKVVVE